MRVALFAVPAAEAEPSEWDNVELITYLRDGTMIVAEAVASVEDVDGGRDYKITWTNGGTSYVSDTIHLVGVSEV